MPLLTQTKEVNPELSRLSYEQHHKQDAKGLRINRNRLLLRIQERSKDIAGASIDEKLAIIEQSNRSTQMFEDTRATFRRRSPLTSLRDSTGKYILNRQEAGTKIKQHFQDQFSDHTRTPVADDSLNRPLNNPISA
ncbi:RxLR effector candidate protein [Phytophthora palmivora]|uniref:RxLR effector candidate protein n=1 Tax=Phytophthora palmivora TaxID=4796 RepID=A0A2P4Y345_9STRA|nr:RxLR effector candidate protein [Phytophthora palmivora]